MIEKESETMKMLISGNWVDAANRATIDVTNPYDGKLLETVPNAAKEDVDRAIADAVTAQKQWNRVIVRERAKILRRYLELLTEYRDELARTLTLETGKPIFDSYGEIDSVYMTFESSIEIVKHQYGKTMPMGIEGGYDDDLQVTVHEPLGVIACIVGMVVVTALKMRKKAVKGAVGWLIAAACLVGMSVFGVNPAWLIVGAIALGLLQVTCERLRHPVKKAEGGE